MKTKTSQQYKVRKVVFSVTLDPGLVLESVDVSDDGNFSKHTTKALIHYNKYLKNIEDSKQK